jgi:hypothetical protein
MTDSTLVVIAGAGPDGCVAWASSQATPESDELRELRSVLAYWFGI